MIDIAFELTKREDVKRLLNHYDNPSEEILTFLSMMINQFLAKDSFVIFDEMVYRKYPKRQKSYTQRQKNEVANRC